MNFTLSLSENVDSENPANPDELIALVTQEKFDAISTIDKADKKCEDHVLVCKCLLNLSDAPE